MKKGLALLAAVFIAAGGLPGANAEETRIIRGDYEYEIREDGDVLTAYHGLYLPRHLPEGLERSVLSYPDVFGPLIRENDLYYYGPVAEDEMYIFGYAGYSRIAMIPEELDGVPVTGIGDYAFWLSGCERDPFAEVVVVPGSVKSIGERAFSCTGIGYICLEDGLEEIGAMAFEGHSQVSLAIPASVRTMGANPFADHMDLGYVNGYLFPNLLSNEFFDIQWSEGGNLLYDTRDMRAVCYRGDIDPEFPGDESFTVMDGIRVIGERSFLQAEQLKEVILPDTVTVIGKEAFLWCTSLESVRIPDGVTEIGESAFYATSVTSLYIPSSVTVIGEDILDGWMGGEKPAIVCDPGSEAEAYALRNGYPVQYRQN